MTRYRFRGVLFHRWVTWWGRRRAYRLALRIERWDREETTGP